MKSLFLLCLSFISFANASAQEMLLMGLDLPHEIQASFPGNQDLYNTKIQEITNRSGIRAVLDTLKEFRQTAEFNRQQVEAYYGFDSMFNMNFYRSLRYVSSYDQLIPLLQRKSVFHSSGQILLDTFYIYSSNDGIWINSHSFQNKFDGEGNNVVSKYEEWSDLSGKWHVKSITDRIFNSGLLMNEATRISSGEGSSANVLASVTTWEYDGSQRWTKIKGYLNSANKLILNNYYKREFKDDGNLKYLYSNDIADPERIPTSSVRFSYLYDEYNRLIEETLSTSYFPLQEWRFSSRERFEYGINNKPEKTSVEFWDSITSGWNLQSYFENEFDSYGNIILETHYKKSSVLPDTYVLNKTVEYIYDLDYGPGSFVAIEEVDHSGYMLNKSITTVYRDSVYEITAKEYIYKELQTNSISSREPEIANIFPNPFTDYLHVEFDYLNFPELIMEIYSFNGVLCLSKIVHQKELVQVDKLIPGTYMMLLKTANGEILRSKKIIKQ